MSLLPNRKRRKEDIEVKTVETQTQLTAVQTQTDTDYYYDYAEDGMYDIYGPPDVPEDPEQGRTPKQKAYSDRRENAKSYVEGKG